MTLWAKAKHCGTANPVVFDNCFVHRPAENPSSDHVFGNVKIKLFYAFTKMFSVNKQFCSVHRWMLKYTVNTIPFSLLYQWQILQTCIYYSSKLIVSMKNNVQWQPGSSGFNNTKKKKNALPIAQSIFTSYWKSSGTAWHGKSQQGKTESNMNKINGNILLQQKMFIYIYERERERKIKKNIRDFSRRIMISITPYDMRNYYCLLISEVFWVY